jgi:hypothetical protein
MAFPQINSLRKEGYSYVEGTKPLGHVSKVFKVLEMSARVERKSGNTFSIIYMEKSSEKGNLGALGVEKDSLGNWGLKPRRGWPNPGRGTFKIWGKISWTLFQKRTKGINFQICCEVKKLRQGASSCGYERSTLDTTRSGGPKNVKR